MYLHIAQKDFINSLRQIRLATFLAWEDIRQRYVRTMLGPFWIVLSTGIWFSAMGFVMANIFGQELNTYLPFMVSGLLIWLLISTAIAESSHVLVAAAPLIQAFPIPIFTHYIRFILRNFIIFLHNLLILLIIFAIYPPPLTQALWQIIPGLLLNLVILLNLSVVLSLTNLRFRDTHLAVASALQVLPFVTPIFWDRGMLQKHHWIADINPFYHMVDIVRSPILGAAPSNTSWLICGAIAAASGMFAAVIFARYRHRIIFWL